MVGYEGRQFECILFVWLGAGIWVGVFWVVVIDVW